MDEKKVFYPEFDDIVFENRNKEYGAYSLRKSYNKSMTIALFVGMFLILAATVTPYLMASTINENVKLSTPASVVEVFDKNELLPPPPPPPPDKAIELPQQAKFTAPVVVDEEVKDVTLITNDVANEIIADQDVNQPVVDVAPPDQVIAEETNTPQIFVQEMPEFLGGNGALTEFLAKNIVYPEAAKENGIKGKVYIRFCVNKDGSIDQVSIARGVDPLLDEEAIRVVKLMPRWKPGRQQGTPVSVWYTVPINFVLQ